MSIRIVSYTLEQVRAIPDIRALPYYPGLERTGNYQRTRDDFPHPIGGVQHIAVSPEGKQGSDTSAEAVTAYGVNPSNTRASWNDCVDTDTYCPLLPPTVRPWQHGIAGMGVDMNEAGIGQELGALGTDWNSKPDWWVTDILRMSAAVWAAWFTAYDWPVMVTLNRARLFELARRGESWGLTSHAVIDPANRSDPGVYQGRDTFPWERLLGLIRDEKAIRTGTYPTPEPTPLPTYPKPADGGLPQFWRDLEAVIGSEGFDIYCGRSHYDSGKCRPGKHPHGAGSLHFEGLALDFGRDAGTQAVSAREKIYVSAKIKMLRDYYGPQLGWVHDRGPGDHEDHGHVQARPNITNGKLWDNTLAGVTMYGDRGQGVADWQADLNTTGASLTADGVYGLRTFWATRAWQSSRGLTVDGIIGPGSRTEMIRHLMQIAAGEIGEGIDDLTQYAEGLIDLGHPATEQGVRAFQQERTGAPHHLEVDGIFGPLSRAALEADVKTVQDIYAEIDTGMDTEKGREGIGTGRDLTLGQLTRLNAARINTQRQRHWDLLRAIGAVSADPKAVADAVTAGLEPVIREVVTEAIREAGSGADTEAVIAEIRKRLDTTEEA